MSDIKEDQPVPELVMERGKVYQSNPNPESGAPQMVFMTMETWTDTGTYMQSLKNIAASQDKRIKDQNESEKILLARLTDVQNRLDNLRAVRREEKRPEIEALLEMPINTKAQ